MSDYARAVRSHRLNLSFTTGSGGDLSTVSLPQSDVSARYMQARNAGSADFESIKSQMEAQWHAVAGDEEETLDPDYFTALRQNPGGSSALFTLRELRGLEIKMKASDRGKGNSVEYNDMVIALENLSRFFENRLETIIDASGTQTYHEGLGLCNALTRASAAYTKAKGRFTFSNIGKQRKRWAGIAAQLAGQSATTIREQMDVAYANSFLNDDRTTSSAMNSANMEHIISAAQSTGFLSADETIAASRSFNEENEQLRTAYRKYDIQRERRRNNTANNGARVTATMSGSSRYAEMNSLLTTPQDRFTQGLLLRNERASLSERSGFGTADSASIISLESAMTGIYRASMLYNPNVAPEDKVNILLEYAATLAENIASLDPGILTPEFVAENPTVLLVINRLNVASADITNTETVERIFGDQATADQYMGEAFYPAMKLLGQKILLTYQMVVGMRKISDPDFAEDTAAVYETSVRSISNDIASLTAQLGDIIRRQQTAANAVA